MGKDPSRRSRDLTPRERRAELQRFSPADAAFVAHLTGCDRCREHAARLLIGEEAAPKDGSSRLPPFVREVMLHLMRAGYLLALADDAPQDDLPLSELQKFLQSLSSEQAAFIGHLLGCERCLQAAARTLKPRPVPPPRNVVIVI
jgi:hypothetical protein